MANSMRNTGARPYGTPLRAQLYTANAAIYPGDFVVFASTGNVTAWSSSGTATLGVAASYASGQGAQVVVWDHPDQLFVVQADGSVAAPVNVIGMNANITNTSGSATYKVSRMQLMANSIGTTTTFPLKVFAIDNRPDNAFGTYADIIVQINNHVLKGGTGTLGI